MAVTLVAEKPADSRPLWLVAKDGELSKDLEQSAKVWLGAHDFTGQAGKLVLIPGEDGSIKGAVLGTGDGSSGYSSLITGAAGKSLPPGKWYLTGDVESPDQAVLGICLGNYKFTRYGKSAGNNLEITVPETCGIDEINRIAAGVFLTRDLVNTPAADMGPVALAEAAENLGASAGAEVSVIEGDRLLEQNFPMIHAVGRAGQEAPRLIDMIWGDKNAPKITLVGKGVTFDTGGLDIKPASAMLLMKKDMGGAANVLGLASMIMSANLPVRLRVLIPAVENAIAGNAFRPGDVLRSRAGLTVEIGNTDAEGRLVLADALTLAVEGDPDLLIDMATLTGAARVALGPDLAPYYTDDEKFADELEAASVQAIDPVWRMPLWPDYEKNLASKIADTNNITKDGNAGSVTAALFLRKFAGESRSWAHFDIFAWNPADKPHAPVGGEAQAIRAIYQTLKQRYSA